MQLADLFEEKCQHDLRQLASLVTGIFHSTLNLISASRSFAKGVNETNNALVINHMFKMSGIAGFPMPPHIKDRYCQLLKEEEDNKKNDKKE